MICDFYRHLVQILETEPISLATIISIKGSVPREVGAKMMIWEKSRTVGTIGGGAGESKGHLEKWKKGYLNMRLRS